MFNINPNDREAMFAVMQMMTATAFKVMELKGAELTEMNQEFGMPVSENVANKVARCMLDAGYPLKAPNISGTGMRIPFTEGAKEMHFGIDIVREGRSYSLRTFDARNTLH